jgi:putative peptidoglycan lipid II flippase
MSEPPKPADSGGVIRAAGAMGAATFISRILGLVREQVFAYLFGAGNATDAFNVAFRIPNLLRDLFAEGAMSASLVPTFTRVRTEEGERRAWRVCGLVFRLLFVTATVIAVLGIVFAPQLVEAYASAYHAVPGKFELTVKMTRLMYPFFPMVAVAAAFMGILNACGYFFLPALASAFFNLGSITVGAICALVFMHFGASSPLQPIEGMAIGVLFGGAVQSLFQLPSLYRAGYRFPRKHTDDPVWFRDPALRRMLWMMVPGTIGLAATQVNILVNTVLATSQGSGAVSWLNYANRLMLFPIGIFGVSLSSATLPRISQQWVLGDVAGVEKTLTRTLRHVLAINLPASAGLAFLGLPIIQMIFQHGRFALSDAEATARALAAYSVGLTAYSAVKVLVPACYALGNTRLPVISSFLSVVTTIILNLLMIRPFGYWGLALGTSAAAILNSLFLLWAVRYLMRAKGGTFHILPLLGSLLKHLVLALAMGLLCFFSYKGLDRLLPDGMRPVLVMRLLKVGLIVFEGAASVGFLAAIFRIGETQEIFELFFGKIKNKLRGFKN